MRVLLHDSHSIYDAGLGSLRAYGGAPGESVFVRALNDKLVPQLHARGITVARVAGDMKAHPEFSQDWDLFLAPHYESDTHGHESGWFWGRAASSTQPAADDRFGAIFERRYSALPAPPQRQGWMTVNVTDYYAFRYTTASTPGVLLELGVGAPVCNGHGQPSAPDHDWLRANVDIIATTIVDSISELGGVVAQDPLYEYTVAGPDGYTAAQLEFVIQTLSEGRAPKGLGALYFTHSSRARVKTSVAVAQAMHETGFFKYGGTEVGFSADPSFNNFCGLKTTDGLATARFTTPEDGVKAHVYHLAWYAHPDHVNEDCSQATDPRHFGPGHRHKLFKVADFGNGVWNGGETYAPAMVRHLASFRAAAEQYTQEGEMTRETFSQWWLEMYAEVGAAKLFDKVKKHTHPAGDVGTPVFPAEE